MTNKVVEVIKRFQALWHRGLLGKAICFVILLTVVKIVGCFFGSGETVVYSKAMTDPFFLVLKLNTESEIGYAYRHHESPYVRVLHTYDDGVLVGYVSGAGDTFSNLLTEQIDKLSELTGLSADKMAYISIPDHEYVDGSQLKDGIYVRDGRFTIEYTDGSERTVESYSILSDEDEIKRFNDDIKKQNEEKERTEKEQQEENERKRIDAMRKTLTPERFDYGERFCVQGSLREIVGKIRIPVIDEMVGAIKGDNWQLFEDLARKCCWSLSRGDDADTYEQLLLCENKQWKIADINDARYVNPWLIESHGADAEWIAKEIDKGKATKDDIAIVSVNQLWFSCYNPTNIPIFSKRKLFLVKLGTLLEFYHSHKNNMSEESFVEYLSDR